MRPSLRIPVLATAMLIVGLGAVAALHNRGAHAQANITLSIQAPTNGATVTSPVTVRVTSSGVTIKAATDQDPNAGHYHYFLDHDPATVVKQGQQIPTGQPDIIHSADPTLTQTFAPGPHTVWVVLAHTDHTPYNPNVQAQVAFTVAAGGAQATPAPGATRAATPAPGPAGLPANGDDFTMLKLLIAGAAVILLAGGYGAVRMAGSRR